MIASENTLFFQLRYGNACAAFGRFSRPYGRDQRMVPEIFCDCCLECAGPQAMDNGHDGYAAHSDAIDEPLHFGQCLIHAKTEKVQPVRWPFFLVEFCAQPGTLTAFCLCGTGSSSTTSLGGA